MNVSMFPQILAADILRDPLALFVVGLSLLLLFFWYFATDFERRKRNLGTIIIVGVVGLCSLALFPPTKDTLRGGVDIVGGSSFTLRVQPNIGEDGTPLPVTREAIRQAISTIEKRLDPGGTQDLLIQGQGEDRIIVQMPGISPKRSEAVRETLEQVAKLELREVHPNSMTLAQQVLEKTHIEPGYKVYQYTFDDEDGEERSETILLRRRSALDGTDIAAAFPDYARPGHLNVRLNSEGEDKMIALTKDMTPGRDRIAIVLDEKVLSAPTVQSVPLGRQFEVSGLDGAQEAQNLASALMNPLQNPLIVEEQRAVSPTLGEAVIKQGVYAGIIGLALTFVFIVFYYRVAGLIALVGLVINILLLFGVMAMFGFTFTLPGIAGIILSIGMAVDANVLIYERLREEIRAGKSLRNAIQAAYEKAFSAIFDANITSLITAIILFWRASGTVKGFAVTLTIGLLASMFAALLVTRVLFWWGNDTKVLKKLTFLHLIPNNLNFDFLGKRRIALVISIMLGLLAIGAFGVRKEAAFGIDFTGGTLIRFQLGENHIPVSDVNAALADVQSSKRIAVQEESSPATGELLSIRSATEDADAIIAALREDLPILAEQVPVLDQEGNPTGETQHVIPADRDEVSATLGKEFIWVSLTALAIGLLGILVYITIRYELAFAFGAFVALVHDIGITTGLVVLFGGELSLIHVGAILTIAGYSINDTIIVFDRIREDLQMRRGDIKGIMNGAINATLSRTLLTSTTTIFTVAMLYIFGGSALKDFSFMILIGLFIGTYSSIFVASPIVLWWSRARGTNLRRELLDANLASEFKTNP